jgi:hypothetical protein
MSTDLQARAKSVATTASGSRRTSKPSPSTPEPPRIPGRRNPKWIALGAVALCLGALLSYVVYSRVATETAVIMMAHTVYRGETIDSSDLTVVRLSGETVAKSVPAAQLNSLVGQKAVYDLPEGAVLTPGAVGEVVVPAEGRSVVGIKLATGRAPAALLTPASRVRLVALPPATTDPGTSDQLAGKTYSALIIDQAPGADGASIVINVDVKNGQAPTVAMLAAADRIVVVRDPAR